MAARRAPSREELALWRAATREVKPLTEGAAAPIADTNAVALPEPATPRLEPALARPRPPLPELTHDSAPGVDRRTAERFRVGQLPIEARLDLHGMTQEEAHGALDGFLARAQEAGQRCVLVITGKGGRRGGEDGSGENRGGVLRAAVPRWLNEPRNRARLLAFAPARPRHGGGGALYLLLRRRR